MTIDVFLHIANVLFLLSYSVRDILWLRVLTIVASLTLLPYYFFGLNAMEPIYWNAFFISINGYQLFRLIQERRPVQLSDEQHRLYRLAFRSLKPREFLKLVSIANWESAPDGDVVVKRGNVVDRMLVVLSGSMAVRCDGEDLATLGEGHFVGEMSYLTGKEAGADVVASGDARFVSWDQSKLQSFLQQNGDLRAALQGILGADLAGKLRAASSA